MRYTLAGWSSSRVPARSSLGEPPPSVKSWRVRKFLEERPQPPACRIQSLFEIVIDEGVPGLRGLGQRHLDLLSGPFEPARRDRSVTCPTSDLASFNMARASRVMPKCRDGCARTAGSSLTMSRLIIETCGPAERRRLCCGCGGHTTVDQAGTTDSTRSVVRDRRWSGIAAGKSATFSTPSPCRLKRS